MLYIDKKAPVAQSANMPRGECLMRGADPSLQALTPDLDRLILGCLQRKCPTNLVFGR